jgi:DNA-directed RNA polymerase specialized sigma24 family protein
MRTRDVTVDEREWPADRFETNRTHLRAVAYRMLGSVSEADDAVQESWLRLSRSGAGAVDNLPAWLRTVTARVCLDMLRSRRSRREEPFGARLARFARPALVNGAAGIVVAPQGRPVAVAGFTVAHDRIVEIDLLADPARLRELDLSALDD